jgi:uncharacterized surface protein with fasciclin (FAS1) repeats
MSFALPTTTTIVDKYPIINRRSTLTSDKANPNPFGITSGKDAQVRKERIWDVVAKYEPFAELVRVAQMQDLLKDPQTRATVFVPIDLNLSSTTLKSCIGSSNQEWSTRSILDITPEIARTMVNSVIVPTPLTTTMMIQSAFTRYRTRDLVNTLIVSTPHCVQFESNIYNRPPFGLLLNNRSRILTPDIHASNGIVHTTDTFPYVL